MVMKAKQIVALLREQRETAAAELAVVAEAAVADEESPLGVAVRQYRRADALYLAATE
jgi:hypothetical protein